MRILLIEDEKVLAESLCDALTDAGYSVDVAQNGTAALRILHENHPQFVLLDLLLPGQSGYTILGHIKQSDELKDIPVFILSMLGSEEDIERAMNLGADGYMMKSDHTLEEIVKKIAALIEEHGKD